MKTAFPWVPITTWTKETRAGRTRWTVTVRDTAEHPEWLHAATGHGSTPDGALKHLLEIVGWWLDYDGRRGGTAKEVYGQQVPAVPLGWRQVETG